MTRNINSILLVGTVAREPELRYTNSGLAFLDFTLAGEDDVLTLDGTPRSVAWYHRVSLGGALAETWSTELKAGTPLLLEGTLDQRTWESPEGQKRSSVTVKPQRIEKLERPEAEMVHDAGGGIRLMHGLNEVRVSGFLGRDAELKHSVNGDAYLALSVAVSESWRKPEGDWQEKTHWLELTFWRHQAELGCKLRKGDPVMVVGRLKNDNWTDKEGQKRSSVKVEVNRFELLHRLERPAKTAPTLDDLFSPTETTPNNTPNTPITNITDTLEPVDTLESAKPKRTPRVAAKAS
jgi:single-strand DNA-binding protein